MTTKNYNEFNVNHLHIYLDNTREMYAKTEWLAKCVSKRKAKGLLVTVEHLAGCSTMKSLVNESARYCRADDVRVTKEDKAEAARRQANYIINDLAK